MLELQAGSLEALVGQKVLTFIAQMVCLVKVIARGMLGPQASSLEALLWLARVF